MSTPVKATDTGPDHDYREHVTLDEIPEQGQMLLMQYSGRTQETLLPHVLDIRDKAFKLSPFPCIGQVRFLGNRWPSTPQLDSLILPKLRAGATLIDVGCGLGQDIRFLHFCYGVDASRLYATDIDQGLMDLGFELFRDRDRFGATFFRADMLDPRDSLEFSRLRGSMDLIVAQQFFHCWDWDAQVQVAKNVAVLSRGAGAVVVGTQVGSRSAGTYKILEKCAVGGVHYRHSRESLARLWEQVGEETGTRWVVGYEEIASLAVESSRDAWWADPGMVMFRYTITRQ